MSDNVERVTIEQMAESLDPEFLTSAKNNGALRLLEALAEKSEAARAFLDTMDAIVVKALEELGLVTAAKNVADEPQILELMAEPDFEGDGDDYEEADKDEDDTEEDDPIASELEKTQEAVKQLQEHLKELEDGGGHVFGKDWDNPQVAGKSNDKFWDATAFDIPNT